MFQQDSVYDIYFKGKPVSVNLAYHTCRIVEQPLLVDHHNDCKPVYFII